MEEQDFRKIFDTLKFLKTEDAGSKKLEGTIVTLLGTVRKQLSFDQSKLVEEEFGDYEQKRLEQIPEKPPEIKLKEPKDEDFPPEKVGYRKDYF
ncbi:MAG: hypothetical protein HYY37_00250 [Candidatus Aenigmarchaeota archaeon]|nr:hypothetical protein [Candidatus Aenigmarchaeota archaeon]